MTRRFVKASDAIFNPTLDASCLPATALRWHFLFQYQHGSRDVGCGADAVLLKWDERLLMVGPHGDSVKYEYATPPVLRADELLCSLEGEMAGAVVACAHAARDELDAPTQRRLLRAAAWRAALLRLSLCQAGGPGRNAASSEATVDPRRELPRRTL